MLNPLNTKIIRGDCHPELPRAHQYHRSDTYGGGSMSIEEAQVLMSMVCIIKPEHVYEGGTEAGMSAAYMAMGCKLNGFGTVTTVEADRKWVDTALENFERDGVQEYVRVIHGDVLEFLRDTPIAWDFGLIDTSISMRAAELSAFLPKLRPGGIVAIHDTAVDHPMAQGCRLLEQLKGFGLPLIQLPSPRGLTLIQKPQ